jgi:hypothetical protein
MRVVTVENFGRVAPEDSGYIYEGDGWLFRFTISSEEHFFKDQLPNLVRVLDIDIRQIMTLALYGNPGGGLFDVRVFISFEEPPRKHELEQLQLAVPESPIGDHSGGILDELFLEFVKNSAEREKRAIYRALQRSNSSTNKQPRGTVNDGVDRCHYIYQRGADFGSGNLVRLHWQDELSPSFADWCNVNFYLAEALRDLCSPLNLIRLEFRAIPDTEHLYDIEADILVEGPMKFYAIRTKSKTRRPSKDIRGAPVSGSKAAIEFVPEPAPLEGLDDKDHQLIAEFKGLPLQSRIHIIWQKHVARFFM